MGFKNREICSYTIAVAIYRDSLNAYLNAFLKRYNPNITKMSLTGVNVNAGKKAAPRKWFPSKSPDLLGQTQQHDLIKNTVGTILNEEDTENRMVAQNISNSGMKIKIRRKTPVSPSYNETTTTFKIILITGNIAKCTGCCGKLFNNKII